MGIRTSLANLIDAVAYRIRGEPAREATRVMAEAITAARKEDCEAILQVLSANGFSEETTKRRLGISEREISIRETEADIRKKVAEHKIAISELDVISARMRAQKAKALREMRAPGAKAPVINSDLDSSFEFLTPQNIERA